MGRENEMRKEQMGEKIFAVGEKKFFSPALSKQQRLGQCPDGLFVGRKQSAIPLSLSI